MTTKRAALDLAAFLDSEEARALAGLSAEEVRGTAEIFLGLCYDELGKTPRLLQGDEVEQLVAEVLPTRVSPTDPMAEQVPAVLEAFFRHLEASEVVTQAWEIRRGLEAGLEGYLEAVRTKRRATEQIRPKSDPFVHGAPKLGRNDPCSCGSGKKYKKCHGKNA